MQVRRVWLCVAVVVIGSGVGRSAQAREADPDPPRSRPEVEALIDSAGRTPPDWWSDTPLEIPDTLQLEWPEPRADAAWQPERNPEQYLLGVIRPNPRQWRGGAKLFHRMLTVNRARPQALAQVMDRLGHIYTDLLGDYARGAFWYRQAGAHGLAGPAQAVGLARCYWELGNRAMAEQELSRVTPGDGSTVQLWAEMGNLTRALEVADRAGHGRDAPLVNLAAGNACRAEGDYARALVYYEKVINGDFRGSPKQAEAFRERARSAIAAVRVVEALDLASLRDGTYRGSALGYRSNVEVEVVIAARRIVSVKVTDQHEDWSFTALTEVPRQIVAQQGLKGVDAVTGATMTSTAIVSATARALEKALP